MMHIAHLSPQETEKMMLPQIYSAIAYHNDFHSDQKGPREMSDADIERLERELAEEERNT